jgi:WD40 repeat protein
MPRSRFGSGRRVGAIAIILPVLVTYLAAQQQTPPASAAPTRAAPRRVVDRGMNAGLALDVAPRTGLVAVGSLGSSVRSLASGRPLLVENLTATAIAFDETGEIVIVGSGGQSTLLDLRHMTRLDLRHFGMSMHVAAISSTAGRVCAINEYGVVHVWTWRRGVGGQLTASTPREIATPFEGGWRPPAGFVEKDLDRIVDPTGSGQLGREFAKVTVLTNGAALSRTCSLALGPVRQPAGIEAWDLQTGQRLSRLATPAAPRMVATSPDGGVVAAALANGDVRVWKSGAPLAAFERVADSGDAIKGLRVSDDGTRVAVAMAGRVVVYDPSVRRELKAITTDSEDDAKPWVALAFAHESKTLLVGCDHEESDCGGLGYASYDLASGVNPTIDFPVPIEERIAFSRRWGLALQWNYEFENVRILGLGSNIPAFTFGDAKVGLAGPIDFGGAGDALLIVARPDGSARIWDVASRKPVRELVVPADRRVEPADQQYAPMDGWQTALSGDGTRALTSVGTVAFLWNAVDGSLITTISSRGPVQLTAFLESEKLAFVRDGHDSVGMSAETGREVSRTPVQGPALRIALGPDGSGAVAVLGAMAHLPPGGRISEWMTGSLLPPYDLAVTDDAIVVAYVDGTIRVWDRESHALRGMLTPTDDSSRPRVFLEDGGFWVPDLWEESHVYWVAPNRPFEPLGVEVLARQFFDPDAFKRLFTRTTTAPVARELPTNLAQPVVAIEAVRPSATKPGFFDIDVTVKKPAHAGTAKHVVRDIRVFANRRLAAALDAPSLAQQRGWDAQGTFRHQFAGVPAPAARSGSTIEFGVYAFNGNDVRSEIARQTVEASMKPSLRGRAHLVCFGVGAATADSSTSLAGGADGARSVCDTLTTNLRASGEYAEVEMHVLGSETDRRKATKSALRDVLQTLEARVGPSDVVILYVGAHGIVDEQARDLFIFPSDHVGTAEATRGTPQFPWTVPAPLRPGAISGDNLARWLAPINPRHLVVLLDTCQAEAAITNTSDKFVPTPLGARGLGQLMYDKRALVFVAATQQQAAGLTRVVSALTEGLGQGLADQSRDGRITVNELLTYAATRIEAQAPEEQKRVVSGSRIGDLLSKPTPKTFDYSTDTGSVRLR